MQTSTYLMSYYSQYSDLSKGKMELVTLSQPECRIATYIGRLRRGISVAYDRKETRHDWTPDGFRNDVEAAAAEMAVAKYLNIYPEWQPTPGAVPGFDLTWNGQRLDVKSTQRPDGNLLIPYLEEYMLYILVCGKLPKYTILGKVSGSKVPFIGRWTDMKYRACWLVPANQLEPLIQARIKGEV